MEIDDQALNSLLGSEVGEIGKAGSGATLNEALLRAIESSLWVQRGPGLQVVGAAAALEIWSKLPEGDPLRPRLERIAMFAMDQQEVPHLRAHAASMVGKLPLGKRPEFRSRLERLANDPDPKVARFSKQALERNP
jgi:hypothetical protein